MATGFPTSVLYEIEYTAGSWTDISSSVRGESVTIQQGRDSLTSPLQPGTLDFELDNYDGTFMPDNPLSSAYPNFVEGKRVRVRVVKGSTFTRFLGKIERIEPDYPTVPGQGVTRVSCIDVLGDLARTTIDNPLPRFIKATPATSYRVWPLLGSSWANDYFLGASAQLQQFNTTAGVTVSPGGDTTFALGGECMVVNAGVGLTGMWDSAGQLGFIAGAFFNLETSAGELFYVGARDRKAANIDGYTVYWNGAGQITVTAWAAGASAGSTSVFGVSAGWHCIWLDDINDRIVMDGVATALAATATNLNRYVSIGGTTAVFGVRDFFVSNAQNTLGGAFVDPGACGLDVGATLPTIAKIIAYTAGISSLGVTLQYPVAEARKGVMPDYAGSTVLDMINALVASAGGIGWVNYSGTLNIGAPSLLGDQTVTITVDAVADMDGGPTLERTIADKVASGTAKTAFKSVTVTNDALAGVYGTSSAEVACALSSDLDLLALASSLVAPALDPGLRISQVTVDLVTAQNDLYASFFGMRIGQRLRLTTLPSAYFGISYIDGFVFGWKEMPSTSGYAVTFLLVPADSPVASEWDSAAVGRWAFGDGVATVSSAITSSGTTLVVASTGATLTTDAAQYPLDLDVNGERMTVASAPASSTSPQTVTVTRGIAPTVARAHAAGERVEIWNAARWAL